MFRGNGRRLHERPTSLKSSGSGWYKHRAGHDNREFVPHMKPGMHRSFAQIREDVAGIFGNGESLVASNKFDAGAEGAWLPAKTYGGYLEYNYMFCSGQSEESETDVDLRVVQRADNTPETVVVDGASKTVGRNETLIPEFDDVSNPIYKGIGHDGFIAEFVDERTMSGPGSMAGPGEDSTDQCGRNNCAEKSFVGAASSMIRAAGLHVRHDDICESFAKNAPLLKSAPGDRDAPDSCNLRPLSGRSTFVCNKLPGVGEKIRDYHEYLQDCHDLEEDGTCAGVQCELSEDERECVVKDSFMVAKQCEKINDDKFGLQIDGSADFQNVFQRKTRYARPTQEIPVHNILGVATADEDCFGTVGSNAGCRTARGLGLALQGSQLEAKFRKLEHSTEQARYIQYIEKIDSLVGSLTENLQPDGIYLTTIPSGEDGWEVAPGVNQGRGVHVAETYDASKHRGTATDQLCGKSDAFFGIVDGRDNRDMSQVTSARAECVCRGHDSANGADYKNGFDEIYLYRNFSEVNCADFKNGDQKLFSVQQYCNDPLLHEVDDWAELLEELKPKQADIPPQFANHQVGGIDRNVVILSNIDNSLNWENTMNRCGRITNAWGPEDYASNTGAIHMSNVGSNVLPFTRSTSAEGKTDLAAVLYQLEAESISDKERAYTFASQRGIEGPFKKYTARDPANPINSDMVCAPVITGANTLFSFQQLSWRDSVYDKLWREDTDQPESLFSTWSQMSISGSEYWDNQKPVGEQACIPNWQLYFGAVQSVNGEDWEDSNVDNVKDRKVFKLDPLGTEARDILEIGFNVNMVHGAEQRNFEATSKIIGEIKSQLELFNTQETQGTLDNYRLVDVIGFDVFEHYARVAAAESDPNAVTWNSKQAFEIYFGAGTHDGPEHQ